MWLDAFNPKPQNVRDASVSGVNGVRQAITPRNIRAGMHLARLTSEDVRNVNCVSQPANSVHVDTVDTNGHRTNDGFQSVEIDREPSIHASSKEPLTRLTPLTRQQVQLQKNSAAIAEMLVPFQLDRASHLHDPGYPAFDLQRVNNMAWEFMAVDGMHFDCAIRLAAEIVVSGQVAVCEATYANTMELFEKVRK